jgi:hypothetical protein
VVARSIAASLVGTVPLQGSRFHKMETHKVREPEPDLRPISSLAD